MTTAQRREQLDNLIIALQSVPDSEGLIRLSRSRELLRQIKFLNSRLAARGVDSKRMLIAISDRDENLEELWLIRDGSDLPACQDCLIIRAADFEKIESLFRSKKN